MREEGGFCRVFEGLRKPVEAEKEREGGGEEEVECSGEGGEWSWEEGWREGEEVLEGERELEGEIFSQEG